MIEELSASLKDFQAKEVPVVIISTFGAPKVWSSGHDIKELPGVKEDPLSYDDPLERLLRQVQHYPGAVIARVHGSVFGGACDLVMTCDLVIGDESAAFAITPVKLGLPYNATGVMHFMNRLGLNVAKEMFFTADPVDATRALQIGILNHLVESSELENFTRALGLKIASRSALGVAVIKEQFRLLAGAHALSPDTFERIQGLRRRVYRSQDYQEGIAAFVEKRSPKFVGK